MSGGGVTIITRLLLILEVEAEATLPVCHSSPLGGLSEITEEPAAG